MKAEELRIGNWIMDVIGAYKKVNANHILHASNNPDNSYTPIPIQPSILEKAGFEKDGFHCYNLSIADPKSVELGHYKELSFSGDYLYLKEWYKDKLSQQDIITVWNKDLMKVFYVHSLQNLYFTLCGSELPLNL